MRQVSDTSLLTARVSLVARRLAVRTGNALMASASFPLPRFGTLAAIVIGATTLYGVWLGGHGPLVVDSMAVPAGFSIQNVDVEGNAETSEIDVLQALWGTGAQSLLTLDVTQARHAIESMPWVDRASVAKIYPNNVLIELTEHRAYAIWQKSGGFVIIDREGREIVSFVPGRFGNLPLVVGTGAAEHAAALLDEMEVLPELRARVTAYIRVGDRRWDIRLENGVTVRLPEENAVAALAEVARMDQENGLLSRDIESVDMRLADRMVIALTPDALVRRNAALEKREQIIKRAAKDDPV